MPILNFNLPDDHFIPQYVEYFQKQSGGYREFKTAAAINLIGIATERRLQMPLSFGVIYPNTWNLILGQAGNSGKSTTIDQMKSVLQPIEISSSLPNKYSREALYEALSECPQAHMIDAECGGILSGMHRAGSYLNGLADDMCELYDCPGYLQKRNARSSNKNKSNIYELQDIFVNLFYATTPATFEESTIPQDFEGGLLSRFLIYKPNTAPEYVPVKISQVEDLDKKNILSAKLKNINDAVKMFYNLSLLPSQKALDEYNTWQKSIWNANTQNTNGATLSARMRVYALKLSMILYCGSSEFPDNVESEYRAISGIDTAKTKISHMPEIPAGKLEIPDFYFMEALQQVKEYYYPTAEEALKTAVEYSNKSIINQIIKILEKSPNYQLTRTELMRKISGRVSARELTEYLYLMAVDGSIEEDIDTTTDGRGRPKNTQVIRYIKKEVINED